MERLSPLDAVFLEVEDADPHASLAIASVAVVAGPAPSQEEFVDTIGARLRAIPRARQKVRRVPLDLDLPLWVDDPHFDVGYHIRRAALPAPGDDAALCRLVARIMAQRLDRDRPLWECWVIEGLAGGHWAVLSKVHHCLVDGVGGAQLSGAILDGPAMSTEMSTEDMPRPKPAPSMARLVVDAVGRVATNPAEQVRLVAGVLRAPVRVARQVTAVIEGLAALAGAVLPAAPSSLSGPIGRPRRYRVARASLPDIVAVGKTFGVTVNDVILAAISTGFRTLLLARGEDPAPDTVRTLVPVSVRATGQAAIDNHIDNQISVLLPFLPVDLADPVEALMEVHDRLATLKAGKEAAAGQAVTSLARHEPFAPLSWGIRLAARLPQRNVVTVTTNVPGPRLPLQVLGREIVEISPFVPIALRMRLGVAVLSYQDRLTVGITGDYDSAPDIDVLADAIEQGIADLVAAPGPAQRSTGNDVSHQV